MSRSLQDVFEENERVRCLITNVDQESQRVSLSTADLEEMTGDMLLDKVPVKSHLDHSPFMVTYILHPVLSTAELEEMMGSMLLDKVSVKRWTHVTE